MRLLMTSAWAFGEYVRPTPSITRQLHRCVCGIKRIDKGTTLTTKEVSKVALLKHRTCGAEHWSFVHLLDGNTPFFNTLLPLLNLRRSFLPSVFPREGLAVHLRVQSPVTRWNENCRRGAVPRAASAEHRVVHASSSAPWLFLVRRAARPNHRLPQMGLAPRKTSCLHWSCLWLVARIGAKYGSIVFIIGKSGVGQWVAVRV